MPIKETTNGWCVWDSFLGRPSELAGSVLIGLSPVRAETLAGVLNSIDRGQSQKVRVSTEIVHYGYSARQV